MRPTTDNRYCHLSNIQREIEQIERVCIAIRLDDLILNVLWNSVAIEFTTGNVPPRRFHNPRHYAQFTGWA